MRRRRAEIGWRAWAQRLLIQNGAVDEREALQAALVEVALAGEWHPAMAVGLVDFALRRWGSYGRRRPRGRTREQDLLRGFKEQFGDDIYLEPGWLEHVAERFSACLVSADGTG
jgi:hypothetical protein